MVLSVKDFNYGINVGLSALLAKESYLKEVNANLLITLFVINLFITPLITIDPI